MEPDNALERALVREVYSHDHRELTLSETIAYSDTTYDRQAFEYEHDLYEDILGELAMVAARNRMLPADVAEDVEDIVATRWEEFGMDLPEGTDGE